jgi:hypothetical protein
MKLSDSDLLQTAEPLYIYLNCAAGSAGRADALEATRHARARKDDARGRHPPGEGARWHHRLCARARAGGQPGRRGGPAPGGGHVIGDAQA